MKDKLDQLTDYLKLMERIFPDHNAEAAVLSDGSIVVDIINDTGGNMEGEHTIIEHDGNELYAVYHTGEHQKLSELTKELVRKLANNQKGK